MFIPRSVSKAAKPPTKRHHAEKESKEKAVRDDSELQHGDKDHSVLQEHTHSIAGPSHEYANEVSKDASSTIEEEEEEDSDADDDEPVVSYSKLQRWPEQGEPVCVVCGRYGAYIVDQTDRDVCSLECKARHLLTLGITVASSNSDGVAKKEEDEGDPSWRYREHVEVASLSCDQVERDRQKFKIRVKGSDVARPVMELRHLSLPAKVESNLIEAGYSSLTAVQMQTIPAILSGRDVLVCAPTGSGKTLSFLIPIIVRLVRTTTPSQRASAPHSLILTPTRELAMQIEEQAKHIMRGVPSMRTALVVGGLPLAQQLHRLKSAVQMIVATPARLNDIIDNHPADIELSDIEVFVLDEVDCLLHLGFETQVREIEELLPQRRLNLMFSATIPPRIERLAKEMMEQPLHITVGEPGAACDSVRHTVMWVEEASKRKKLIAFFNDKRHFKPPVVVFVNSKMGTLLLADAVNKMCPSLSAVGFHGDMTQERRSSIVQGLLEEKYSVVVATPILGRGVDLAPVKQVFIFDMPSSFPDYIHQVGRAGSHCSPGWAVTFVNNENKHVFADLVDLLQPLGVQLPSQLLHSPLLGLQREQRKRKMAASEKQSRSKRTKEHSLQTDGQNLMELIKSHHKKERHQHKH